MRELLRRRNRKNRLLKKLLRLRILFLLKRQPEMQKSPKRRKRNLQTTRKRHRRISRLKAKGRSSNEQVTLPDNRVAERRR